MRVQKGSGGPSEVTIRNADFSGVTMTRALIHCIEDRIRTEATPSYNMNLIDNNAPISQKEQQLEVRIDLSVSPRKQRSEAVLPHLRQVPSIFCKPFR